MRDTRYILLLTILLVLLPVAVILALYSGRFPIAPAEVWAVLSGGGGKTERDIVLQLRLPRVGGALLVGMALSVAGTVYQGIFRNPLVSPDLLGVSGGACVGAAAAILLGLGMWNVQLLAFAGGLLAVMLTMSLPRLVGNASSVVLVLSGIVVSGFAGACLGLVKYLADPETQLAEIVYWQMGSLAKTDINGLQMVAPVMLVAALVLFAMRWRINVLSLGDREARLSGANIRRERGIMVAAATLLTASAVCLSGTVGWLGLVVPHLARMLGGDNNLKTLPLAALIGALFLLGTDTLARNLYSEEIPLGILTGFIGAPFFAWVLVRQKRLTDEG